ncbi:Protein CUP-SHAPED COTYLEDON 3 [Hordeum vulgare]|nr:Protein CUP-SHAPED COTYLEDON 3 [Hordeum vulgare]
MEGLDVDDVFQHCHLNPTEVDAVTYYLPRLLSGETLHGVEKLIHSVEISGCEPKDLAARYAPMPQALSSGDRFFFTTCKSKNGSKLQSVRSASGGTWTIQKTTEISHAGGKVGEVKNLSFKKNGKSTGWGMEYWCLLPEAIVTEGVKVF